MFGDELCPSDNRPIDIFPKNIVKNVQSYNAISPLVRQALEETFKIKRMFISFPQPYIFEVQSLANINTTTNERKRFTIPQERINEILRELIMSVSTNGHLYRSRS